MLIKFQFWNAVVPHNATGGTAAKLCSLMVSAQFWKVGNFY